MKKVFCDRSRVEQFQRCPRSRWLGYHEGPERLGVQGARKPLPLVVGGSVHVGLQHLLLGHGEQAAVDAALADLQSYAERLELDTTEQAGQAVQVADPLTTQLTESAFKELGLAADDPLVAGIQKDAAEGARGFDLYLQKEQGALVEAMVRAYARRRLRPLLEQYEVLEVEREGEWLLSEWDTQTETEGLPDGLPDPRQLWFMSRPDALLRDRQTNDLLLLSFKTAASWDIRKAKDAEHDMQGLSEGVEVERRLGEWWEAINGSDKHHPVLKDIPIATQNFLRSLSSPPRILGIRYEYLLKGERWKDSDLAGKFGFECRSQKSPLIRGYLNPGMAAGDEQWNVSWDYVKDDGSKSKLYYKNWRSSPVWERMSIREWIDKLDGAEEVTTAEVDSVGQDMRSLGWRCDAQATGYLTAHPLDECFIPPIMVYRNDDELRDWIEQVEAQEVAIAQAAEMIHAATDEGEKRHLLNVHFQNVRRACEYPTTCQYTKICWGGEDIRREPLASGLFVVRAVNHKQELSQQVKEN